MGEEEALGLFMCLELPSACRGAGAEAGALCVQELLGSEVLRRWQGRSSPWAVQLLVLSLGAQHKGTCLAQAMPTEAPQALRKAGGALVGSGKAQAGKRAQLQECKLPAPAATAKGPGQGQC